MFISVEIASASGTPLRPAATERISSAHGAPSTPSRSAMSSYSCERTLAGTVAFRYASNGAKSSWYDCTMVVHRVEAGASRSTTTSRTAALCPTGGFGGGGATAPSSDRISSAATASAAEARVLGPMNREILI